MNDTSYFQRTFHWSGTDRDGWVTEFHVSIRTDGDNPAPWDTTTVTDTTMTFVPDPTTGEASATFLIACRDNRGAMSDTVVQHVPMRNFPPVVAFQSDYEPLRNLQRELIYDGVAVVDTIYWNWGPNTFRFTAYDLDGLDTMNDYYRYTLVDGGDPDTVFEIGDPAADPELGWVTMPFGEGDGSHEFEIFIADAQPGARTLTVSVQDEAGGDPRFQYSWEVREPRSSVLMVQENGSTLGLELYNGFMDGLFGERNWDEYRFVYGFPDHAFVLLENMRKFEAVVWVSGSGDASDVARTATVRDGVLWQYVQPQGEQSPGRLLLISPRVCAAGANGLGSVFIGNILGINAAESAPQGQINGFSGHAALPQGGGSYLPGMTGNNNFGAGRGMIPLTGTEELYRMEECMRCYSVRPPFDPVVGVRRPARDTDPLAGVVTFSVSLEYFDHAQVMDVLTQVLEQEMGVTLP